MADAPFDPSGAVTFDLSAGRVSLAHAAASVLAPAEGLARLCDAAGQDATRAFGKAVGREMGARITQRLPKPQLEALSLGSFAGQLRGEFAIAGFGSVGLERWGSALVFLVQNASVPTTLVAAVLEAALETATGRKVRCVTLPDDQGQTRLLVTNERAAERVEAWMADGMSWGEVMVKLHERAGTAKPGGEA